MSVAIIEAFSIVEFPEAVGVMVFFEIGELL
ncbi:heavy metal-translocating P-type ATPase [Thermosipho africanus H17ap60334]|nr:heavy metal-translocating P-type ATPase [Thermosipho africanus H17ap60334]